MSRTHRRQAAAVSTGTLLYDIKNKVWSREILERYGLDEERLPKLRWSGEAAGVLLPEVAEELGLSKDCVVAVGAQDIKKSIGIKNFQVSS